MGEMSTIPQIKALIGLGVVDPGDVRFLIARLEATQRILAERERELLEAKGNCSLAECGLHYAHGGPCNIQGHLARGNQR